MQEFRVTEDHIKLLQNAVVRWEDCEFGAPAIDCKRPYGNSGVYEDIIEILDLDHGSVVYDELRKLHEETETVLQIFLATGKMEPGLYKASDYTNWTKGEQIES